MLPSWIAPLSSSSLPSSGGSKSADIALPHGFLLINLVLLGMQSVIYTIDGWDGVIYFSEEVKNPGRDVPRAIFASVFSIMGVSPRTTTARTGRRA